MGFAGARRIPGYRGCRCGDDETPRTARPLPRHIMSRIPAPWCRAGRRRRANGSSHGRRTAPPHQTRAAVRLPRGTQLPNRWPRRIRGTGLGRFCVLQWRATYSDGSIRTKCPDFCPDRQPQTLPAHDTLSREVSREQICLAPKFGLTTGCREKCRDHGFLTSYFVAELAPTFRNRPNSTNLLR